MGKPTGFLEWQRLLPGKRPTDQRTADYAEFVLERTAEQKRQQAGRCMDCGVPFCMQGCPLGNQIPEWNDLVYRDRWESAWRRLDSTNNFPEFTGRLCPAPCEAACTLTINTKPVTIEQIEREIVERAFTEGWVKVERPRIRTGKHVAIVGSGPAGLAAAMQLNRAGHRVTVFERDDRIGGLLRYGIPDFKLEKRIIDRRLEQMRAEGVEFETGVEIGDALSWTQLKVSHDAVLIATGARVARDFQVPGRDLDGVHFAMDFLEQGNRLAAGDAIPAAERLDVRGKRVVILGGGDTGSDCLGTSHRQGAAEVTQVELFPAPPRVRTDANPWPQWPVVFRTSSSQTEGGTREFALMTKSLVGEAGKLTGLVAVRVELVQGEDGRSQLVEVEGSQATIPVDMLILAMGFTGPETSELSQELGVGLDRRGNVVVDENYKTSVDGVYAAGDAHRGASLIVWAIAEGREAARAIDLAFGAGTSALATRGIDQAFGGR